MLNLTPDVQITAMRDKVILPQEVNSFGTQMGGLQLNATHTQAGSGNDVFIVDPQQGISLGSANFATAPFSVTLAGVLTATSGHFSGDITGATGTFSGALVAGTIDIGGSDTTSFHVDADGNMWLGAGTLAAATAKITNAGVATFSNASITGGSVSTSTFSGLIALANLNIAAQGWTQTSVFTVTDADTVSWGSGTFTTASGTAYSINAGNTGNMAAKTYIYLDIAVSSTAYQTTTTATTAIGAGKVLIAVAQNGTGEATFTVLQGAGGQNIDASSIVAGSITSNEINAGYVYAGSITAAQITAGTITSQSINLAVSDGNGDVEMRSGIASGDFANAGAASGFIFGIDDSDSNKTKFYWGNATNYVKYDGSTFSVKGTVPDAQTFTSNGTWTKPAGANFVRVVCIGAGGGGGGGANGTGLGGSDGGTGGGGGAYTERVFLASDLGDTITITVGTGGSGGGTKTSGTPGGASSFGTDLYAYGGGGGFSSDSANSTVGAGGGGSASVGPDGTFSNVDLVGGSPGVAGNAISGQGGGCSLGNGFNAEYGGGGGGDRSGNTGGSSLFGAAGGGSGGGGGGPTSGAAGGNVGVYTSGGGGAGGTYPGPTQNGANGTNGTAGTSLKCGTGGGGGSGAAYGYSGGNGGNGGAIGGGGGGGGGTAGSGNGGTGGTGGRGEVRVYCS